VNVSADIMVQLAQALGVSGDLKAEGVARVALERLRGEREYFLEVLDDGGDGWVFVSIHEDYAEAQEARSAQRARFPASKYRIVELLKRVLP
jgi:hypothetical protein